ncbi:MAG TPA: peptidoglycan DD-metalloendopeptidase family protein [Bacteroidota bacterium]|nr:peptidoglycan DD-metalloendopeptidase family protein [Bacteroidota bacterium]
MPIARIAGCLALLVALSCTHGAARQDQIKKKQSQLQKLRKEINDYEKKIKEKEKKERATLDLLENYDRQSALLGKLVQTLQQEEQGLVSGIDSTRNTIGVLNDRISYLKRHYANYVATAYKYGQTYDLELLLSSKSINQALIRSEYLKRFSRQRKQDIDALSSAREQREEQSDLLERELAEQRDLISEKAREERNLQDKTKKRKQVLSEIRRDKKNVQKEVGRKIESAKQMEQLIAKLIEADREKKEREKKERETKGTKERAPSPKPRESTGAFEAKRGQYRWPVAGGKLVGRFGNQENPTLHTITQNTGVDVAVSSGTAVEAIADGEVSTIWWLPSFGNLVIISHNDGYRTVYAHLSEIFVNEGDNVTTGTKIGQSGEALSGPLFHFELWKDRDKQDPEQWLRPRGLTQK